MCEFARRVPFPLSTHCLRTPKKTKRTIFRIKGNIEMITLYSFGVLKQIVVVGRSHNKWRGGVVVGVGLSGNYRIHYTGMHFGKTRV